MKLALTFDIGQTKKVIQGHVAAHQGPVGPEGRFLLRQLDKKNIELAALG